jgi:tetratricopeptide (TPR) repeat protein
VALEPAPPALDTLAEAYYVTGRHEEAVQTIDRALAANPENKAYFLEQRQKFLKAQEASRGTKTEKN